MKLLRLAGRKNCDRVRAKGNLWRGKHMLMRWMPGYPRGSQPPSAPTIFVGLLASSKLDKSAVKRNKMRRRCREALRIVLKDSSEKTEGRRQKGVLVKTIDTSAHSILPSALSLQLLILPRSTSLRCAFDDLKRDLERFLSVVRP